MCFDGENLIGKTIKEIRWAEKLLSSVIDVQWCVGIAETL